MLPPSHTPDAITGYSATSDEGLIAGIQRRQTEALAALIQRHTPLLRAAVSRVVRNDADTEEVVSLVFMEIWKCSDYFELSQRSPLGLMLTLARRRALDLVRHRQSHSHIEERLQAATPQIQPCNSQSPVTDSAERNAMAQLFQRFLVTLPIAQKTVIELHYYEGLSQRGISARLGVPLGTVKTRLELGIHKLRDAIVRLGNRQYWLCS